MDFAARNLPLLALALMFVALLLLDFAFDVDAAVYVVFVPVLSWGVILARRERG